MNCEKIRFNNIEQEPLAPDTLKEQINLPREQWSDEFRQLVEEKTEENQKEQAGQFKEYSEDDMSDLTFKRYMRGLGLDENDLRDKRILDLGSGEGYFVKLLIQRGITSEAYGIDIEPDEDKTEKDFKSHLIRGDFEKGFPIKEADYIISIGAVSNGVWAGEEVMDIGRIVKNSLVSLKEDGEIRIYPIQEAAKVTPLEGLEMSQKKWQELLTEISEAQNVECKIEPRNIQVTGKNNDIVLESVLVMRRKEK